MSSLLLLNGSPRGERSNSSKMLTRVAQGWERAGGQPAELLHLALPPDFARSVDAFGQTDVVLLAMPLYTDAMPGLVKTYIEAIGSRAMTAQSNTLRPTFGFLVQSGFPEALHSRYLERYFEKLARRLGTPYAGTIVRGGGGALEDMPENANKKLWLALRTLGEQLARNGRFNQAELKAVAGIERFPRFVATLLSVAARLRLVEFMWNSQLKKNSAWERRFDAPYGPALRR